MFSKIQESILGKRFGRLVVVGPVIKNKWGNIYRLCRCDCGKEKMIYVNSLVSGHSKSCGCLRKEISRSKFTTHGKTDTRTYRIWCAMKTRTTNKNDPAYKNYGGRGIKLCPKWNTFSNFLRDMGVCPAGKEIDRIDNDKGYSPGNCRWTTRKQNQNNKRSNRFLECRGKRQTLMQWANERKVNESLIRSRLNSGWSVEAAVFTSAEPNSKRIKSKGKDGKFTKRGSL